MTSSLAPLSPAAPSYRFTDGSVATGWVKSIVVKLYKTAVLRQAAFEFDKRAIEFTINYIQKNTFFPEERELEDSSLKDQLALLAVNLRDERLPPEALWKEIRALPPAFSKAFEKLLGSEADPRRLLGYVDKEGRGLLDSLIKQARDPELLKKEWTFREGSWEKIDFTGLEQRIREVAFRKLAAECDSSGRSNFVAHLDLETLFSKEERMKAILARIELNPTAASREVLWSYALEGRVLVDCVLRVALNPEAALNLISVGGLPRFIDGESRFEIVTQMALSSPKGARDVMCVLESFRLEEALKDLEPEKRRVLVQNLILACAQSLAHDEGWRINPLRWLDTPEEKLAVTLKVIEGNPTWGALFFQRVYPEGLRADPETSLKIARHCVLHSPLTLNGIMSHLTISDEAERFQLAKAAAQTPRPKVGSRPSSSWKTLSEKIGDYGITDPKARGELAKDQIEVDPAAALSHWEAFALNTVEERLPLIKQLVIRTFNEASHSEAAVLEALAATRAALQTPEEKLAVTLEVIEHTPPWGIRLFQQVYPEGLRADPTTSLKIATHCIRYSPSTLDKIEGRISWAFSDLIGALYGSEKEEEKGKAKPSKVQDLSREERVERLGRLAKFELGFKDSRTIRPIPKRVIETLELLIEYKHSITAMALIPILCSEVLTDRAKIHAFVSLAKKKAFRLPMIVPAAWGASKEEVKGFDKFIGLEMAYGGGGDREVILHALLEIFRAGDSSEEKIRLIERLSAAAIAPVGEGISSDKKESERRRYKACFESLSLLGLCRQAIPGFFLSEVPEEGVKEALERRLVVALRDQGVLDCTAVTDFGRKYLASFGQTRVPYVLFTYAQMHTNNRNMQPAINRFATAVLEGGQVGFRQERYRRDLSKHLQYLAAHDPSLWSRWQEEVSPEPLEGLPAEASSPQPFNAPLFLREKILVHNHDKEEFSTLRAFLKEPPESSYEEALAKLQPLADGSDPHRAERLCLELCEKEEDDLQVKLGALLPELKGFELENDVQALLSTHQRVGSLTIVDSDDWQDLFLAGSEVDGSCQRILGGGELLNQCLLGYVLDGKNRMIAVKDSSGGVVARAIFRLLLDRENDAGEPPQPALMLEPVYQKGTASYDAVIEAYAKKRAKALGVPLFQVCKTDSAPGKRLYSWSSSAPYEYSDASAQQGMSGVTRGVYSGLVYPL